MKQSKTHDNLKADNYLSKWKANHKLIEMGQARCVKLYVARLIDVINDKKSMSPAVHQLLGASLILKTTDSKILSVYLKKLLPLFGPNFKEFAQLLVNAREIQRASLGYEEKTSPSMQMIEAIRKKNIKVRVYGNHVCNGLARDK
jgi:hypothetical protein